MAESPIISTAKLESMPWPTMDPFLFCVHHLDNYPAGDENMVPKADLSGRSLGSDFSGKNGFSMYHGQKIPGFPRHPHRGFETISIVRKGFIDHADSMGATARFGNGDVQWMTAGKGVVHSEMFPLVHTDKDNPTELFQIWINLPKADKFKEAYFTMFWQKSIPKVSQKGCQVTVVAGEYQGQKGPTPPPSSWASREDSKVAVWTIKLDANSKWTLPKAVKNLNRVLYFFSGKNLTIGDQVFDKASAIQVQSDQDLVLENADQEAEILLLQGKAIAEPVVQYGPFVMNTREEIGEAYRDYQSKGFGAWPWPDDGPVHSREQERFAIHADGKKEQGD